MLKGSPHPPLEASGRRGLSGKWPADLSNSRTNIAQAMGSARRRCGQRSTVKRGRRATSAAGLRGGLSSIRRLFRTPRPDPMLTYPVWITTPAQALIDRPSDNFKQFIDGAHGLLSQLFAHYVDNPNVPVFILNMQRIAAAESLPEGYTDLGVPPYLMFNKFVNEIDVLVLRQGVYMTVFFKRCQVEFQYGITKRVQYRWEMGLPRRVVMRVPGFEPFEISLMEVEVPQMYDKFDMKSMYDRTFFYYILHPTTRLRVCHVAVRWRGPSPEYTGAPLELWRPAHLETLQEGSRSRRGPTLNVNEEMDFGNVEPAVKLRLSRPSLEQVMIEPGTETAGTSESSEVDSAKTDRYTRLRVPRR